MEISILGSDLKAMNIYSNKGLDGKEKRNLRINGHLDMDIYMLLKKAMMSKKNRQIRSI